MGVHTAHSTSPKPVHADATLGKEQVDNIGMATGGKSWCWSSHCLFAYQHEQGSLWDWILSLHIMTAEINHIYLTKHIYTSKSVSFSVTPTDIKMWTSDAVENWIHYDTLWQGLWVLRFSTSICNFNVTYS